MHRALAERIQAAVDAQEEAANPTPKATTTLADMAAQFGE
jgi:hypothetical protein